MSTLASSILVRKRDGSLVDFNSQKIRDAIAKALAACNRDRAQAEELTELTVEQILQSAAPPSGEALALEDIQDAVERVLMRHCDPKVAKAYILYREGRSKSRNARAIQESIVELFNNYLDSSDWRVKENANTSRSVNGLNNYLREHLTGKYWLHAVYPEEIAAAHEEGAFHIHDLGFFGPYCAGWDLMGLLIDGFTGVGGKVGSKPARHLRSFLGQIVNATFTYQGESAGAQAWSGLDTYCAPFIRHDGLNYTQVRQALQEFVFNMNVPTRVGFQCPFSNVTLDITVPKLLRDRAVVLGGEAREECYGDFQAEMDLFNLAFFDVLEGGDAVGRVFTFPIPTINVTPDFPWEGDVAKAILRATARFGIPYFANFVTSDLSPEDAVSMCCRLRLDTSELKKRGGGLFGSNPLTGSLGVVTLNLPRIAYESKSEKEFFTRLRELTELAASSLEIKRKVIDAQTEGGLYPYAAFGLRGVKQRHGSAWAQHFSTIGVLGMHEALLNLDKSTGSAYGGVTTQAGIDFAARVLDSMKEHLKDLQERYGHVYNLEATPAEGCAYRLAKLDKLRYPDIVASGGNQPYYCNSSQLPAAYTEDILEAVRLQDGLQSRYTGGTVLHLYLKEAIERPELIGTIIQRLFKHHRLPYLSFTPTFSVCPEHGYLKGEVELCPHCGKSAEVWTRVVGYLRPVSQFNPGKQEEYAERREFSLAGAV